MVDVAGDRRLLLLSDSSPGFSPVLRIAAAGAGGRHLLRVVATASRDGVETVLAETIVDLTDPRRGGPRDPSLLAHDTVGGMAPGRRTSAVSSSAPVRCAE